MKFELDLPQVEFLFSLPVFKLKISSLLLTFYAVKNRLQARLQLPPLPTYKLQHLDP